MRSLTLFLVAWLSACQADPLSFASDVAPQDAAVLLESQHLEIYALDPAWPGPGDVEDPTKFHGYGIRGQAKVADKVIRLKLLQLVAKGCRDNEDTFAACFDPRHGVRAEHGGRVVDLVICYECYQLKTFVDGKAQSSGTISPSLEPQVSAIYRSAGLSIAGAAK